MHISIGNGGINTFCQLAEVTEHRASRWRAQLKLTGHGARQVEGYPDDRTAQLEFHDSDEIERLIQHLKKLQAEFNLELLDFNERQLEAA